MDVTLEPYLSALAAGNVSTVTGRAYEERRRPQEPDRPIAFTVIMLVPRSEAVLQRLQTLKARARENATAFRGAAAEMRRVKNDYETAIWQAGAPHLAPVVAAAADGSFRIPDVPAGQWMLIAWHAEHEGTAGPKRSKREEKLYTAGRRLIGFDTVQVWVREIVVGRGTSEPVELSDRNVWFSGVEEDTMLDAGR
jgi:hypothetical protein